MPTWTTSARVTPRLLTTADVALLTGLGITVASLITDASAIAETDLEPMYWPFPDVTGGEGQTILTPLYIQDAVALKAASLGRIALGVMSEIAPSEDNPTLNYGQLYMSKITALRREVAQIPLVRVAAEAMTFGTGPLDDDQYKFNPQSIGLAGFEVIPESVRMASYQYGVDFRVEVSTKDRGWLFIRMNSAIVDTNTVSYDFTYRKGREKAKAIRFDSAELIPS